MRERGFDSRLCSAIRIEAGKLVKFADNGRGEATTSPAAPQSEPLFAEEERSAHQSRDLSDAVVATDGASGPLSQGHVNQSHENIDCDLIGSTRELNDDRPMSDAEPFSEASNQIVPDCQPVLDCAQQLQAVAAKQYQSTASALDTGTEAGQCSALDSILKPDLLAALDALSESEKLVLFS